MDAIETLALMARYEPYDMVYRKARERGLKPRAAFNLEGVIERFKLGRACARGIEGGGCDGREGRHGRRIRRDKGKLREHVRQSRDRAHARDAAGIVGAVRGSA